VFWFVCGGAWGFKIEQAGKVGTPHAGPRAVTNAPVPPHLFLRWRRRRLCFSALFSTRQSSHMYHPASAAVTKQAAASPAQQRRMVATCALTSSSIAGRYWQRREAPGVPRLAWAQSAVDLSCVFCARVCDAVSSVETGSPGTTPKPHRQNAPDRRSAPGSGSSARPACT
jgi:hypothetical protein